MSNQRKTSIWVKHSFKGLHNWPEAGQIAGHKVDFLESTHRHTFHVKVEMEVFHDDRDEEFFILQSKVENIWSNLYDEGWNGVAYNLGRRSCETIASELIDELRKDYPNGFMEVHVSEDNEVGARVRDYQD